MAGRPIRSALLIDIENVSYARLSTSIPNWLAWLERGQFDPAKQRRKFVLKRAYWNSTSEHDRKKFESRGVDAILVDRYVTLKNTADVHMAIDMIELLYTRPDIEEYVLLSKDSDFIPVMQRLRSKHKKTVMLVDLASPTLHTAFRDKVDIVIPHRDLLLATTYNPPLPKPSLFSRWRANLATTREQAQIDREAKKKSALTPAQNAGGDVTAANTGVGAVTEPVANQSRTGKSAYHALSLTSPDGISLPRGITSPSAATPPNGAPFPNGLKLPNGTPLQQAAILVSAVLKQSRGSYVPQKTVLTQLQAVPEFTEFGAAKFFGFGTYRGLLSQLASDDPLIKVDQQPSGHTAVRYLSDREQQYRKLAAERPLPKPRPNKFGARHGTTGGLVAAVWPPPVLLTPAQAELLDAAMIEIRQFAQQRPGAYLPRQGLLDAIASVPGIGLAPPDALLGLGSLSAFMFEVARRDPDFFISEETGGGKGYRYAPRDPSKLPAPLPRPINPINATTGHSIDEPTPVPSLPPMPAGSWDLT
jgi:uncharacterized LabA/DUF88 family protein